MVVNETWFSSGQVVLQNLPSLVCGWVVNAQPYEYIIDMCAAPGNKTTHLGEMSNNKVKLYENTLNLIKGKFIEISIN